jgi:O-methyltransferase
MGIDFLTKICYSTRATILNTIDCVLSVKEVPGCFVECGVAAGAQIIAMRMTDYDREIYGFDSFEGIPMAGPNDTSQPGIGKIKHDVNSDIKERLVSSGITSYTTDQVLNNFKQAEVSAYRVNLVKGWFQDTVNKFNKPIALLRLDGDLYESTLVCLQYLYPFVSVGGIIIIDDYGLDGCRQAVIDYFDTMPEIKIVEGGNGPVYFYKK